MNFNTLFIIILGLLYSFDLKGQLQLPGNPWSKSERINTKIPLLELAPLDNNQLLEQLSENTAFHCIEQSLDPLTMGKWTTLNDGRRIWQLEIFASTAEGLGISFNKYKMPKGAQLFIHAQYNNRWYTHGAFTDFHNKPHGKFIKPMMPSNRLILELNLPSGLSENEWFLKIRDFHYGFFNAAHNGLSFECNENVVCQPWASEWCNEIRSTVKLFIKNREIESGAIRWSRCSGVLVHNNLEDPSPNGSQPNFTPYIVTAAHCVLSDGAFEPIDPEEWIVYFNFHSPTCQNSNGNAEMTAFGLEVLYSSEIGPMSNIQEPIGSGDECPDIALMEGIFPPPVAYNVYYAGWDVTGEIPENKMTRISHPLGDVKKIGHNIDVSALDCEDTPNGYWQFRPLNGAVQGGSSGGPFFTTEHLLTGIMSIGRRPSICEDERFLYAGQFRAAYGDGIKNHIGLHDGSGIVYGADPLTECIPIMKIEGAMYPGNDWQTKNDILVQSSQEIWADRASINESPTYMATTHQADYTFKAKSIRLTNFTVQRGNVFKALVGNCTAVDEGCGTNYAARPVHEVDENSFFETAAAQKQGELFIQPNPSNGQLQVALPQEGGFLRLYNANGQLIWQQANCNQRLALDFSQFQAGFYLLQWQNEEEMQTKKLILR